MSLGNTFRKWLSFRRAPIQKKGLHRYHRQKTQLRVEELEPRTLLSVVNVFGDQDYTNENDSIRLVRDSANPALLDVFVNNTTSIPNQQVTLANQTQINVFGFGGNDNLIVDSGNGLINVADGIQYDGGAGFNNLTLYQSGGATQTSDAYSVGPNSGEGSSVITGAGGMQTVFFQNLAPVQDDVPATTVTINATTADNAINYSQGAGGGIFTGNTGFVTVDDQESYEFNNKTNLVINALAGSDEINLHYDNTLNPAGLTGAITINGADPTAGDTLTINGIAGVLDNLRYVPTSAGAGTVINDSEPQPNVLFTGIGQLNLAGQQADGDGFRVDGTTGNDAIEFFHGLTSDSGSFVGTMDQNNATGAGPFTMTPMSFSGAFPLANDSDVNFFNPGGTDSFVFNGTANDDNITVGSGEAGGTEFRNTLNGIVVSRVEVFNVASGLVRGLDGNDTFNLNVPAGPAAVALTIQGGDSDQFTDTLNYNPPAAAATTIDYGTATITTPGANPVGFSGIEAINETSSGGGSTLTVNGTAGSDNITYTPTGATAGTVTLAGKPTVNFTGVGGAFTIDAGAGADAVTVNGTAGNDTINVFRSSANTVAALSPFKAANLPTADTEALQLAAGLGDDTVNVNVGAAIGSDVIGIPITVDGSLGNDIIDAFGSPLTAVNNVTYTPGPATGQGQLLYQGAGAATLMTIAFVNVETAADLVTASNVIVNGSDADNAINYSGPQTIGAGGRVAVDNLTPIEFSNKTNLVINSQGGSDTINLDYNSTTNPPGLTGTVTVNGGDPTASDTLIVNGITGVLDNLRYLPTAVHAGTVVNDNAPQPNVLFTGIELLSLVVQQADGDGFRVDGTAGNDAFEFFHGPTSDSGTIVGTMDQNNATGAGPFTMTPMTYSGASPQANDLDVNFFNPGGTDSFAFNGTANDDNIAVGTGEAGGTEFRNTLNGIVVSRLEVFNIAGGLVRGLDGNDSITVTTPAGPAAVSLTVQGGGQANDVLNYSASSGAATTIDFGLSTINSTGANAVAFSGLAKINAGSSGAGSTLLINGTTGNDSLTYTPTGATAGTVALAGAYPLVTFTGVGSTFTVNGSGGSDQLVVVGTQSADTIDVNDAAAGANAVKVNSLLKVNFNSTLAHVEVDALAGSDTINAQPSATTTFLVDGGDPIGVLPGDTLNLIHSAGNPYQIFQGPTSDSGGVNTATLQTVSWIHIETLVNSGGGPAVIQGTNGDDEITVIARDSSYNPANPGVPNPALDGVQDFTVSVNDGPEILFINTPFLFIDALSGNDDIVVRDPAPAAAAWNVQVYVAAGAPGSGSSGLGDNIELETPGTQNVTYSPNNPVLSVPAPLAGLVTFTAPAAGGGQFSDTADSSAVTATQFLIPGLFASSAGGVENFLYAGENGNDHLSYNTPANAGAGSNVVYSPGANPDSGTITGAMIGGNTLTPLTFSNLGVGNVTFTTANTARQDHLIVQDLPGGVGDVFNVTPGAVGGIGGGNTGSVQILHAPPNSTPVSLSLLTPGVSVLELQGQAGNDTFNLSSSSPGLPWANLVINDGSTVNLTGAIGPVTVFLGDSSPGAPNPNTVITGYGAPVTLIGIDTANLNANSNSLTATGTSQNDNITYTPTGPTAGTFYNDIPSGENLVPNTVFNIANVTGNFLVFNDPSGNADQVTLRGTNAEDLIEINQNSGVAQVLANNVTAFLPVQLGISVEILNVLGLGGQNTFQVIPGPGVSGQAQDNLLINIDGGSGGQQNALAIGSSFNTGGGGMGLLAANQFVAINKTSTSSGTVRIFQSAVADPDINYVNVQTIAPSVSGTSANPNLLVMGPDTYEPNETLGTAAYLGSGSTINVQNTDIFPNSAEFPGVPADQDYFRVVAQTTGTLDFQVYFRTFATSLLPGGGQLDLQAFDVNGDVIASAPGLFGADPGTGNARIRIPAVAGQSYFLRVFGVTTDVVNGYSMTVFDTAPPTPFNLELSRNNGAGDLPPSAVNSDSGRSQFDNVTKINTPTIYIRLSDGVLLNDLPGNGSGDTPPAGVIPIPFSPNATTAGYRVAVFDGNNTQTPVGFATQVDPVNFPGLYTYTFTTPLVDGIHHITTAVQMVDPATPTDTGFGPVSASLDLTIDTVPPPTFFGTTQNGQDGLDAGSDSGVSIDAPTLVDRVTNASSPTFYGTAEADAIVRVYAQITNPNNPNFGLPFPVGDVLIAQTVATPLDGTNADPDGRWVVTSNINLNDPTFFSNPTDPATQVGFPPVIDGTRTILITGEDVAGNVSTPQTNLVFIDTQGPNVTGVQITGSPGFNLFGLKPTNFTQGPTPLVYSLTINVADLPARDAANFPNHVALDVAADSNPGLYAVQGDQVGIVAITAVFINNDPVVTGQPATGTITLVFAAPLPDDRYTLTISDSVVDPADNALDGESNASMPLGIPTFPSGNGVPGGNFTGRFTVDSRPHIGAYGSGQQQLDVNGNGIWDLVNAKDATNTDMSTVFGLYTDNLFSGNFAASGASGTGFDTLGAYGVVNGHWRFLVATNGIVGNPITIVPTLQINGLPVAYKFNPSINADEVAVFDGHGNWYIDYGHNNNIGGPGTIVVHDGLRGYPIVGDFDGSGTFDLATYQPDTNTWQFDLHPLTSPGVTVSFTRGYPGVMERPVAADMNRDGITDIGLWVPTTLASTQPLGSDWYFLESPGPVALPGFVPGPASPYLGTLGALDHAFNPSPFSQDQSFNFGNGFNRPLVGIWDPPAPTPPPAVKKAPGTFTDVAVTAQVGSVANGDTVNLFTRRSANGLSEYTAGIYRNGNSYTAKIQLEYNGAWTTLFSAPVSFTPGSTLEMDDIGTTVELMINGNVVATLANAKLQTAGAAGVSVGVGSFVWPPRANALSRQVVSLPFADSFAQANGMLLDSAWDELTGSFRTQNNTLIGQTTSNVAVLHGVTQADFAESVDITALPAGAFGGLMLRYTPATGAMYRGDIAAAYNTTTKRTTYTAQIWRYLSGKWTLLASQTVGTGVGTLAFETTGNSQRLFFNGALVCASADGTIKTGTAGIFTAQNVGLTNFAAIQPAFTTTSLPFTDPFNTGTTPGANWYTNAGGFALSPSGLTGVGAANEMTLYGINQLNATVQAQIATVAAGGAAGILARYNATTGNTYWAGITATYNATTKVTTYTAKIMRRINGVWTVLFTKTTGVKPGLLNFTVTGTKLSLSLDGNVLGTIYDGALTTPGTVGVSSTRGGQFSTFSAS
jgi:hypothetical protein